MRDVNRKLAVNWLRVMTKRVIKNDYKQATPGLTARASELATDAWVRVATAQVKKLGTGRASDINYPRLYRDAMTLLKTNKPYFKRLVIK